MYVFNYSAAWKRGLAAVWLLITLWGAGRVVAGPLPTPPTDELKKLLAANRASPNSAANWAERARILFYLGRRSPPEERLAFYKEGRDCALESTRLDPPNSGGRFWWMANEGEMAAINKDFAALGTLQEMEKVLQKLIDTDPDFGYAAPERALGQVYDGAPYLFSIGSSRKAEKFLRAAVKRSPDFPGNKIELAKFLEKNDEHEEAARLVREVAQSESYKRNAFGPFSIEKSDWEIWIAKLGGGEKAP